MSVTIEKTKTLNEGMKGYFKKIQGHKPTPEYIDAWCVKGDVDGVPYEIVTINYSRAQEYARLIDAKNTAGIEDLMENSKNEAGH